MTSRDDPPGDPAELRRRAEELVRGKAAQAPEGPQTRSGKQTRRMLHELRVHQIELELQNEELRRSQAELDAARARYFNFYDLAPVGFCSVNEQGLILETNLTAAGWLGLPRGALVHQPFARFILQEDQGVYYRHHKQLFETGATEACELRMVGLNRTAFWVRLEATAAEDAVGARVGRLVMSDITESKRTEQALRESEERYRQIVETAQEGIWVIDLEGKVSYANQRIAQMLEYPQAEVVGRPVADFMAPEHHALSRQNLARRRQGIHEQYEFTFLRRTGSPLHALVSTNPLYDQAGRYAGALGMLTDITERKRAQEELAASEQRYHSLFENMVEGFAYCQMLYDDRGRPVDFVYLEVNHAFEQLTGLRDVAGKRVSEAIPGIREQSPELFEIYGRVALTGNPEKFEINFAPLARWLSISVYGPEKGRFVAVFENITERKRAQEALRESEEKYRTVADFTYDWECWMSPTRKMRYVSPSCQRITGYSAEQFVSDPDLLPKIIHPDDRAAYERHLCETLVVDGNPQLVEMEFRVIARDGSVRWLGHGCQSVFGADGTWLGRRASNRDITERKRAQEELARSRAEMKAIYDHAPVMMCVVDADRRVLYANPAFTAFTGVSEDGLKGGHACGVFGCINALDDPRGCGYGTNCPNCALRLALEDTLKTGAGHRDVELHTTLVCDGDRREVALLGSTALIPAADQNHLLLCLTTSPSASGRRRRCGIARKRTGRWWRGCRTSWRAWTATGGTCSSPKTSANMLTFRRRNSSVKPTANWASPKRSTGSGRRPSEGCSIAARPSKPSSHSRANQGR